jgi:hypothetical protein
MNIKTSPTECCGSEQPYKRPTIKECAQNIINRYARCMAKEAKLIEFVDKFPEAAKFLEDNELGLYNN